MLDAFAGYNRWESISNCWWQTYKGNAFKCMSIWRPSPRPKFAVHFTLIMSTVQYQVIKCSWKQIFNSKLTYFLESWTFLFQLKCLLLYSYIEPLILCFAEQMKTLLFSKKVETITGIGKWQWKQNYTTARKYRLKLPIQVYWHWEEL